LIKNVYVFEVMESATKIDIKKAITEIYWVEASEVNVLYEREKFKYWKKRWKVLRKRTSKKAYVTLKDSQAKIDFTIVTK
jgi:large subunit ribosomal protein L23